VCVVGKQWYGDTVTAGTVYTLNASKTGPDINFKYDLRKYCRLRTLLITYATGREGEGRLAVASHKISRP